MEYNTLTQGKPRVLFYRPPDDLLGGSYRDYLFKPKDRILRQFFDLVVVHDQRTLIQHLKRDDFSMIILFICADIQKDAYSAKVIRYLSKSPSPRVMLYNTDAHSAGNYYVQHIANQLALSAVLSCEPVVEAYFKFDVPTFYWMWSVDPSMYVQTDKNNDLFVSSRNSKRPGYYSWRFENGELITNKFNKILSSTHDAWSVYQRKLASCRFAFTCGSSNNTVVQKHLEIPASGTCLITEETSLVRMMGFQDGVNCVFGKGSILAEKIDHLKMNPGLVSSIASAGRQLVFDRHTHTHRTQVLELFNLINTREDLRNYYQPNPFGSIIRRDGGGMGGTPCWLIESPPRDLAAIEEWVTSDELGKPQRFEELRSYLKEGHPILSEAWANWVSNKGDLPLLRKTLRELSLSVDGLPDHLVFHRGVRPVYARILQESRISSFAKALCTRGLSCVEQNSMGPVAVFKRLLFVSLGLLLLDVITFRGFLYFMKIFATGWFRRLRPFFPFQGKANSKEKS